MPTNAPSSIFPTWIFKAISGIYCVAGFILLPFYRHELNPDGLCYFSITQKYATLDLLEAINGLWSPLFSWLLVPFEFMHIDLPLGAKIINLACGWGILYFSHRIAICLSFPQRIHAAALGILALNILSFALIITTPDLLSFCLATGYLYLILSKKHIEHPILTGYVGACMYLAKAYFFGFFVAHQLFLLFYIKFDRRIFLRMMIAFGGISLLWGGVLSYKYQRFTLSTAPEYNNIYIKHNKNNLWIGEFLPPPNSSAFFAWEDIGRVYPPSRWDIEVTPSFYLQRYLRNVLSFCKRCLYFQPLMLIILGGLPLISAIKKRKAPWLNPNMVILYATWVIYSSGYMLYFWEDRYIWWALILGVLTSCYILSLYLVRMCFLLYIFICTSMIGSINELSKSWGMDSELYVEARQLTTSIPPRSKIAIWDSHPSTVGRVSYFYAYLLHSQDFGYLPFSDTLTAEKLCADFHLSHLLVEKKLAHLPIFLASYPIKDVGLPQYYVLTITR